jgi:hypothetical protein
MMWGRATRREQSRRVFIFALFPERRAKITTRPSLAALFVNAFFRLDLRSFVSRLNPSLDAPRRFAVHLRLASCRANLFKLRDVHAFFVK